MTCSKVMAQTACITKFGASTAGARLFRLVLALAVLAGVIYGLAPIPVESFGPMREYAEVVRETGIAPGALYYTDVAQSNDAEMNNRDAIRYFAHSGVSPFIFVFLFLYFCILFCVVVKRRRNA